MISAMLKGSGNFSMMSSTIVLIFSSLKTFFCRRDFWSKTFGRWTFCQHSIKEIMDDVVGQMSVGQMSVG
jgi:hypothetical protein